MNDPLTPSTLTNLLLLPAHQLARVDIGRANLLCAEGLPGWELEDVDKGAAMLDTMARRVESETKRSFYKFQNDRKAFNDSEGYFRMLIMATVLQEDFGVRYNPERAQPSNVLPEPSEVFFADSRDVFLHGLTGDARTGTCSSMPVLYVAVGRRLGYPLKLVTTKAHLFLRWEDGRERFNTDGTSRGLSVDDDDYYRRWPFLVTAAEERRDGYLRSLTPPEEVAVFLSIRALTLRAAGRLKEAMFAQTQALRLVPNGHPQQAVLAKLEREAGEPAFHQALLMALRDVPLPSGLEHEYFKGQRTRLQATLLSGSDYDSALVDLAMLHAEIATYNRLGRLGPPDTNILRQRLAFGSEFELQPNGKVTITLTP